MADTMQTPIGASPQLWNPEIAPVPKERQSWGAWTLFGVWASIAAPSSMLVGSAGIAFGFNWWQVILIALIGDLLTLIPLIAQSHGAIRYGLAEPQLDRTRFGIWGTYVPSWGRFFVGLGFWGVQTFLITEALVSMVLILTGQQSTFGSLKSLSPATLVAHDPVLFWLMFFAATAAQYWILWSAQPLLAAPSLRWLSRWMPIIALIVLTFVFLDFIVRYAKYVGPTLAMPPAAFTPAIIPIALVFLSSNIHATQVISWPDMMRFGRSVRAMLLGQIGLPVIYTLTVFYGALMTGVVHSITGVSVYDPILLVAGFLKPPLLAAVVLLTYAALLMNTNIFSNAVPPVYDLTNTWPRQLNWRKGVTIVTALGVAIGAWALYAQGAYVYFNTWILYVATLLGPFAGVIVVDYAILRRGRLSVDDIFRVNGRYTFWRGFNIAALASVAVPLIIVLLIDLGVPIPGGVYWSKASWLFGSVVAGLVYWILMRGPCRQYAVESGIGKEVL